jgi:hypothetical protein
MILFVGDRLWGRSGAAGTSDGGSGRSTGAMKR